MSAGVGNDYVSSMNSPNPLAASTPAFRVTMAFTIGLVICSFGSSAIGAEPEAQPGSETTKSQKSEAQQEYEENIKAVADLLPKRHITRRPLNDETSRLWFDRFLNDLDPRRLYFTSQDIDRFRKHRDALDDHARRGDVSFALLVGRTFTRRVKQATKWGEAFLAKKHDFTANEEFVLKPEQFADGRRELRERWRLRVKHDLLTQRTLGLTEQQAVEKLRTRYRRIAQENSYSDERELLELFLDSLARTYDPHSAYLGERTLIQFRN